MDFKPSEREDGKFGPCSLLRWSIRWKIAISFISVHLHQADLSRSLVRIAIIHNEKFLAVIQWGMTILPASFLGRPYISNCDSRSLLSWTRKELSPSMAIPCDLDSERTIILKINKVEIADSNPNKIPEQLEGRHGSLLLLLLVLLSFRFRPSPPVVVERGRRARTWGM